MRYHDLFGPDCYFCIYAQSQAVLDGSKSECQCPHAYTYLLLFFDAGISYACPTAQYTRERGNQGHLSPLFPSKKPESMAIGKNTTFCTKKSSRPPAGCAFGNLTMAIFWRTEAGGSPTASISWKRLLSRPKEKTRVLSSYGAGSGEHPDKIQHQKHGQILYDSFNLAPFSELTLTTAANGRRNISPKRTNSIRA